MREIEDREASWHRAEGRMQIDGRENDMDETKDDRQYKQEIKVER